MINTVKKLIIIGIISLSTAPRAMQANFFSGSSLLQNASFADSKLYLAGAILLGACGYMWYKTNQVQQKCAEMEDKLQAQLQENAKEVEDKLQAEMASKQELQEMQEMLKVADEKVQQLSSSQTELGNNVEKERETFDEAVESLQKEQKKKFKKYTKDVKGEIVRAFAGQEKRIKKVEGNVENASLIKESQDIADKFLKQRYTVDY